MTEYYLIGVWLLGLVYISITPCFNKSPSISRETHCVALVIISPTSTANQFTCQHASMRVEKTKQQNLRSEVAKEWLAKNLNKNQLKVIHSFKGWCCAK